MIYSPHEESTSEVVDHLVMQIETICQDTDLPGLEDVARAVDYYLQEDYGEESVDSRALVLMAAQALESIGERSTARRYLLHGTGLVKPSEWEVTQGETMWVVDLRHLWVMDGAPLELIFFTGLGIIVDTIADVWDASAGEGALGLRHVSSSATALLGEDVERVAVEALAEEIRRHCVDRLARQRRERGWEHCPTVMDLDIGGQ